MLNRERLYAIIDIVLREAQGYDTNVLVQSGTNGLTRFANSEIHQNVFEDATDVTITVTEGRKRSQIVTSLYDEAGLAAATRDAITNLSFLPDGDEQPALVEEPLEMTAGELDEELGRQYNAEGRARLVKQGLDMLDPGYKAYGALSHGVTQLALGNSRGIKRHALSNEVKCTVLVADEKGGSGYAAAVSDKPDVDIQSIFQKAYQKAKLNHDPISLEPGAYTVVLEPLAVGDLLTYMSFIGFSGKSVQNQASFLTGKIGEKLFDEKLTITDDYTNENTVSLPFDFEGTPRTQVALIERGVAKGVVHDTMSAKKEGVQSTGHSLNQPAFGGIPLNMVVEAGNQSLDEIIKGTKDGLLVTRFHYMNPVNPRQAQLTALTRDGFYKIENGEVVAAVKNMRFTESMLNALNQIEAISSDRQRTGFFFGNYYVPGMKINGFHFTGKTS
ncbi:MAG: TldD/PmbA family protein [Bacillota bacterium]